MSEKSICRCARNLICFGALVGFAPIARAANLQLSIAVNSGPTVVISDNDGIYDSDPTPGVINVNTAALDPLLSHLTFYGLSAVSNSPGSSSGAFLSVSGLMQLLPGESSGAVQILASDSGYFLPADLSDTFSSSASSTFTNSPVGDSQVFRASELSVAGTKQEQAITLTSTGPVVNSHSANAPSQSFVTGVPYQMKGQLNISLSNPSSGAVSQVQFAGSEEYAPAPVPEPASLGLMLGSVVLMCGRRRRNQI